MWNLGEGRRASSSRTMISFPVVREEGLLVETVGDETVVYDLESKEAHCLKPLAAVVFTHADGRTSAEEIAELAAERLGEPITETQVRDAIAQLEASALLDTPLVVHSGNGLSRRQMLGKSAAAAAGTFAGASLITSVMAPVASATGTILPPGACCGPNGNCNGGNPRCSSNHCCQTGKDCNSCKCTDSDNDCSTTQCSSPAGSCPSVMVNGVSTAACASTSGGKCCYPDPLTGDCCRNFQTTSNSTPC